MSNRTYRTAAEVALELGVSLRTVRRWVADGRLRVIRVGRSVRIPVDAFREASLPTSGASLEMARGSRVATSAGEVAADYAASGAATAWPDTPDRLTEQRRRAAALMDRLASAGRPASGVSDTADVILDTVRDDVGAGRPDNR